MTDKTRQQIKELSNRMWNIHPQLTQNELDALLDALLESLIDKALTAHTERIVGEINKYGNRMSELHEEMIAKAHDNSKIMLAFDMHSRLIAVKHIKESINLIQSNK